MLLQFRSLASMRLLILFGCCLKPFSSFLLKPTLVRTTTTTAPRMVRNIDLPEAVVFYDIPLTDETGNWRDGLESLLEECEQVGTAAIWITPQGDTQHPPSVSVYKATQDPPNPRDLWESIHTCIIQPHGFGGSSGFGQKAADPERPPLPKHVVVVCDTVEHCRAARYCGMRVLSLEDNDLADAIVDGFDFYLDDIATPGSFWLNPPHPRDDDGNRVDDIDVIIQQYEQPTATKQDNNDLQPMSNSELDRILADLDTL